ncbi:MAG TPA: TldD/PmbA family protein [Thermoplasmata archaeon]|nr:TldD/PmbA family protein [Thermoplasmata archaeon]
MEDLLRLAVETASPRTVRCAEVRLVERARAESLTIRNGLAGALTASENAGIGIRVRTDRAWGFAATSRLDRTAVLETARSAVRAARAAARSTRERLPVTDEPVVSDGRYSSVVREDPFEVAREEKLALLQEAEQRLHVGPEVKSAEASYRAWSESKWFASSEGRSYRSTITHVGAGLKATAIGHGQVQRRSAPTSFGGDFRQAGFEYIRALGLPERSESVGREAVELLTARTPGEGPTTVVLGSDQLALQVHESVGHATELDRIYAMEAGYAGTSWVEPDRIGRLTYGGPLMNVVADATEPGGLGSFGFDDEGLPARRTEIVRAGQLVGALTSRETAARRGDRVSGATARAEGFYRAPLIRMTNVDLLPGDHTMEELLEGVADGIYLETNRSWSIDDKRLNFQFSTEIGRRIVGGELGPLVRNPIYSGMTPAFWSSLDAVGDAATWHLWGVPNCGKGQPGQVARVGHGAPAARFRNVQVRGG